MTEVAINFVDSVMKFCDGKQDAAGHFYRPDLKPGDASWGRGYGNDEIACLDYVCPCGCTRVGVLPIKSGFGGAQWTWDGNKELPTLSPSILSDLAKGGCGYHGHLVAGVFKSC